MNEPDPFEARLQRLAQRPLPEAWREQILGAARVASVSSPAPSRSGASWLSTLNSQLSTLLWPHPKAWAGLAAAWLVILGLNLATREPAPEQLARQATPPPPQLRQLLQEQNQLLSELLGPPEASPADRPKPAWAQPHSQLYERVLRA